jgi:hypothetical protein
MKTRRRRFPAELLRSSVVALALCALPRAGVATVLCGDPTGDGYVTATDALAALAAAVDGSYDATLDVGTDPDGRVTATDALVVLGASVSGIVPPCAAADRIAAVVSTASCDFATGGIASIQLADLAVERHVRGTVEPDAVVRVHDDRVFVINRFSGSSVQEIARDGSLSTLWRCSVGAGSNPHDFLLVDANKAYVTRYDAVSLAVVDPSVGPDCMGFVRGHVDLSPWADRDGLPEMDQMVRVGDFVFVTIQRLDRDDFFRPSGHGALVVIDVTTDSVVDVIELAISNPFVETKGLVYDERAGRILVGGPGRLFSDLADGGIEAVDPFARTSLGVLLDGAALGGDLMDFAMLGSRRGFAVVADARFVATLVEIDLERGVVGPPIVESSQNLSDIELSRDGRLWVVDRNCFHPGVRVFRVNGHSEVTEKPVYPGLTPFTLDFVR